MFATRQKKLLQAMHSTFSSAEGQLVLAHLLHEHGFLSIDRRFSEKQQDGIAQALALSFRDGERNVIAGILKMLDYDEKKLLDLERMYQEHRRIHGDDNDVSV